MFDRRDKLQYLLGRAGIGMDIGYVLDKPTGEDRIPQNVLVARDATFDAAGDLQTASFVPGSIEGYGAIADCWPSNFCYKIKNEAGIITEHAFGIGIKAGKLINARSVQQYGNEKDAATRDILTPCGAALESFGTTKAELDRLGDVWGGGQVIFKPNAGDRGKGVRTFPTLKHAQEAAREDRQQPEPRMANGLFQPFIDLSHPIPNLKPLVPAFDAQLQEVNRDHDRVREIRMHLFVTTVKGERDVRAYPTLRTSEKGAKTMRSQTYTPLDPEAFEERHPDEVKMAIYIGHTLAEAANAPHLYAAADECLGTHARHPGTLAFVGDLNCRRPRLPDLSLRGQDITTPAQHEFVRTLQTIVTSK